MSYTRTPTQPIVTAPRIFWVYNWDVLVSPSSPLASKEAFIKEPRKCKYACKLTDKCSGGNTVAGHQSAHLTFLPSAAFGPGEEWFSHHPTPSLSTMGCVIRSTWQFLKHFSVMLNNKYQYVEINCLIIEIGKDGISKLPLLFIGVLLCYCCVFGLVVMSR